MFGQLGEEYFQFRIFMEFTKLGGIGGVAIAPLLNRIIEMKFRFSRMLSGIFFAPEEVLASSGGQSEARESVLSFRIKAAAGASTKMLTNKNSSPIMTT